MYFCKQKHPEILSFFSTYLLYNKVVKSDSRPRVSLDHFSQVLFLYIQATVLTAVFHCAVIVQFFLKKKLVNYLTRGIILQTLQTTKLCYRPPLIGNLVLDLLRTFAALCMGQIFPDYVVCKNCSKFSISFYTVVEISKHWSDFHILPDLHRTRNSYIKMDSYCNELVKHFTNLTLTYTMFNIM